MAASYPGAIKSFSAIVNGVTKLVAALFNSPYDEITAIETELGTDVAGTMSDLKTRLAVALNNDGTIKAVDTSILTGTAYLPNDTVDYDAIKKSSVEISCGTPAQMVNFSQGYSFCPKIKHSTGTGNCVATVGHADTGGPNVSADYEYRAQLYSGDGTVYLTFNFVTSSGTDDWVFLLIDKITKEILTVYASTEHPFPDNFTEKPHPFLNYDDNKHDIIIVDKETVADLQSQVTEEKSFVTLVNEEYKPDFTKEEIYQPLHSGKFIDKEKKVKKMVDTIPGYISVRKLIKLSDKEKAEINTLQELRRKKIEEDSKDVKNNLKTKLGLSDKELQDLKQLL